MDIGILLVCMVIVVLVKGLTVLSFGGLQKDLRNTLAEAVEVEDKLVSVEATKLQRERELKALSREEKLLENGKDLMYLKIRELGEDPIPESELDVMEAAARRAGVADIEVGEPLSETSETVDTSPEERGENTTTGQPPFSILVVDDNKEIRDILQTALEDHYAVFAAVDGFDALTKILKQKQHFDMVITDLKMPNINGVTLLEHLPKHMPAIVISAFLNVSEYQEALDRFDTVAVLQKPFKLGALRAAIEEVMETN